MKDYNLPPKVEKIARTNKKMWTKKGLWLIATYTIAVVVVSLIGKSCWDGYWRTHSWEWRTPVIFQNPLMIKELKPQAIVPVVIDKKPSKVIVEANKPLTEEELIKSKKHGDVLWKVYGLESTWGRNDYCRNTGKGFAGFGVLNEGKIVCYETFEKATERAEYWLVKNGVEKDLASTLCKWNTGRDEVNCNYYQSYLSL